MTQQIRVALPLLAVMVGVGIYLGSFYGVTREAMGSRSLVWFAGAAAGVGLAFLLMEANDAGDFQAWWNYGAGRPWWVKDLLVLTLASVFIHGLIIVVSYPGIPHFVDGQYIMKVKGQIFVLSEAGYRGEQADVLRLLSMLWIGFFAEVAARMQYPRPQTVEAFSDGS